MAIGHRQSGRQNFVANWDLKPIGGVCRASNIWQKMGSEPFEAWDGHARTEFDRLQLRPEGESAPETPVGNPRKLTAVAGLAC